jgi:hypothetical protein
VYEHRIFMVKVQTKLLMPSSNGPLIFFSKPKIKNRYQLEAMLFLFCKLFCDVATMYSIVSNGRAIDESLNILKQMWPNRGTVTTFVWMDWGKPRKISTRIADVSAEIRAKHLSYRSLESYHYTNQHSLLLILLLHFPAQFFSQCVSCVSQIFVVLTETLPSH